MIAQPFPLISVSGDAYTRGHQHGVQASGLIRRNVDYYLDLWRTYSKLERDSVLDQASEFIPAIERYDADIMEEMRGLADGAGLSLEEVVALNARYEFVWAVVGVGQAVGGECTALAAAPKATSSRHTLIGQNWDYKPRVRDQCILLKIEQGDKPDILMHTEAGVIGQKGMNSAGMGLCVNALVSDRDGFEPKTPFFVTCRRVLNSERLGDAVGAVLAAERAASGNFLIAHAEGEIIDLEAAPSDVGFMYPKDGVLAHGNNFVEFLHSDIKDTFKAVVPDTLIRTFRAQRLLSEERGVINLETFKRILRDHFNWPNSICRHQDERLPVDLRIETVASVIMDLNAGMFYVSDGAPCGGEYRVLSLKAPGKG